jgi:predicted Zn finger-like uncharacterized protein
VKISCPACAAKYSIADEKVQDRLAKIRCRKCGTTIVIDGKANPVNVYAADGSAPAASGAQQESAPAAAAAPGAGAGAGGEYSVDFGDNDQRTMPLAQLVEAYNAGQVTAETFVWADGMADWQPLGEVAEIVDALHAAASAPGAADAAAGFDAGAAAAAGFDAGAAAPGFDAGAAAAGFDAGAAAPGFDAGAAAPGFDAGAAAAPGFDAGAAPGFDAGAAATPGFDPGAADAAGLGAGAAAGAASPWETEQAHARAAARPGGGRGSTADLFGSFDTAGSEEDVTTSAPQGEPSAPAPAAATGARNESSVLFSLSALTASGPTASKPDATTATREDSGLIDLKALTASSKADENPADADGGFGAPLMAAPLGIAAPLGGGVEAQIAAPGADGGGKSKTGLFVGGAIVVAALVIAGAVIATSSGKQPAAPTPSATQPVATAAPTPSATQAAPADSLAAKPPATGTSETAENAPDGGAAKKPVAVHHYGGRATHATPHSGGAVSNPKPKPKPKAHHSACGCAPGDLECAMRCAAK